MLLLECEDELEELSDDEELLLEIELPLTDELLTDELLTLESELELLDKEELKSELEASHAIHPVNIPVMDVGVK